MDDRLAPGFLIAPPNLADPNFNRTVVLLGVHEESGSMGFVLNRSADLMLSGLLRELGIPSTIEDRPILIGGPVAGFSGFLLYTHPVGEPLAPGIEVTPTVSVSPSRELLETAAGGSLAGPFELLLGYAGWGPGQLEDELRRGSWLHASYDEDLVFKVPVQDRWEEIYSRLGVSPFGFVSVRGGAQA